MPKTPTATVADLTKRLDQLETQLDGVIETVSLMAESHSRTLSGMSEAIAAALAALTRIDEKIGTAAVAVHG